MRLDINLASQPYEDARQFWLRWGTALAAVSILTLAFGRDHDLGVVCGAPRPCADRRVEGRYSRSATSSGSKQKQFLNRPENRSTRDQSQFLNELIERKSFSWTRVLEDLER